MQTHHTNCLDEGRHKYYGTPRRRAWLIRCPQQIMSRRAARRCYYDRVRRQRSVAGRGASDCMDWTPLLLPAAHSSITVCFSNRMNPAGCGLTGGHWRRWENCVNTQRTRSVTLNDDAAGFQRQPLPHQQVDVMNDWNTDAVAMLTVTISDSHCHPGQQQSRQLLSVADE